MTKNLDHYWLPRIIPKKSLVEEKVIHFFVSTREFNERKIGGYKVRNIQFGRRMETRISLMVYEPANITNQMAFCRKARRKLTFDINVPPLNLLEFESINIIRADTTE